MCYIIDFEKKGLKIDLQEAAEKIVKHGPGGLKTYEDFFKQLGKEAALILRDLDTSETYYIGFQHSVFYAPKAPPPPLWLAVVPIVGTIIFVGWSIYYTVAGEDKVRLTGVFILPKELFVGAKKYCVFPVQKA